MKKLLLILFILPFTNCRKDKLRIESFNAELIKVEEYNVENTSKTVIFSQLFTIAIDKSENLWAGSRNGFTKYKNGVWENYYYPGLLSRIVKDCDGQIWIFCKSGIKRFIKDEIIDFRVDTVRTFTSMAKEGKKLWFGTGKNGVFSCKDGNWQYYTVKDGLPSNYVSTIVYDKKLKRIWAGTENGITYFENGKWYRIKLVDTTWAYQIESRKILDKQKGTVVSDSKTSDEGEQPAIKLIKIDERGDIWAITDWSKGQESNLWHYNKKTWKKINIDLSDIDPNDILIDNKNNYVLIGGSGLYLLRGKIVEKLSDIYVHAMDVDSKNNLWCGTPSGLLRINLNSGSKTSFIPEGGLISNEINCIKLENNKRVIIGTDKGLNLFNFDNWTSFLIGPVVSIIKEEDSTFIIVTNNGLKRLEGENLTGIPTSFDFRPWRSIVVTVVTNEVFFISSDKGYSKFIKTESGEFKEEKKSKNVQINAMLVDTLDNNIWMGTTTGLVRKEGRKFRWFTTKEGLPGNHITALEKDTFGNLWIGTLRGLSKFDGKGFTNSLIGSQITKIKNGRYNDIWVGVRSSQLWRIDLSQYPDTFSLCAYSGVGGTFQGYALDVDQKGNVWVGNSSGVKNLTFQYTKARPLETKESKKQKVSSSPSLKVSRLISTSETEDWPVIFHDFCRTNASANKIARPPFSIDWEVNIGTHHYTDMMYSSPIISKGMLFLIDHRAGVLVCLNEKTGRKIWHCTIGNPNMDNYLPMIATDRLIVAQGNDNNLEFISIDTGKKLKTLNIRLTDMVIKDNKIYGTCDSLVNIDIKKKKIDSYYPMKRATLISCDDSIFVIAMWSSICAFRFKDNQKIWEYKCDGWKRPQIYKDRVIIISNSEIHCLEKNTGNLIWKTQLRGLCSQPSVWGWKLYIQYGFSGKGATVRCINLKTGDTKWEKFFEGSEGLARFSWSFSPVLANGIVYVVSTPNLYALDAWGGNIVWQRKLSKYLIAPVIIGSDKIYAFTMSKVFALKPSYPGQYTHKVAKKPTLDKEEELVEDLQMVEAAIESLKAKSSYSVKDWLDEFQSLASRYRGRYWKRYWDDYKIYSLIDSLAIYGQVDLIILLLKKESLTGLPARSTKNVVEKILSRTLRENPRFAKLIFPKIAQLALSDDNLTMRKKAIRLLGSINDIQAVKLLKKLLSGNSVFRVVISSLCANPHNYSISVIKDLLTDESYNRNWKMIISYLRTSEKLEKLESTFRKIIDSDWADSITKIAASREVTKIEETRKFREIGRLKEKEEKLKPAPYSYLLEKLPVESLDCSQLFSLVESFYKRKQYAKTYRYAIFALKKKCPKNEVFLYYKGVAAYNIGEIDIAIETIISLIEDYPYFPRDEYLEKILKEEALKKSKYKNKWKVVRNYLKKQ